jgi:SAM-dependent methyltransferase
MADPVSNVFPSTALRATAGLMRNEVGTHQSIEDGYIDVLGARDGLGPHAGQQVYRRRFFPLIYERISRPFVAWLFFGRRLKAADERRIALEMLGISPGEQVLDVACGPGNYTRHLSIAAEGGLVVGIDASKPMIAAATKRSGTSNLAYVRGDANALPFGDSHFDAVCCVGALHMFEEPMTALDEMTRVLVPGGRVVIVATCSTKKTPPPARSGMFVFGRNELTSALGVRGFTDIHQRVERRGQFVAARKPVQ